MRLPGIVVFIVYFLASFLTDLLVKGTPGILQQYPPPYQFKKYMEMGAYVPWGAILFGLFFSLAALITSQGRTPVSKEEVAGYTLVSCVIQIIITYLGGFIVPLFTVMHLDPFIATSCVTAFFLALCASLGLFIDLGLFGILLTTAVGGIVAYLSIIGLHLPFVPYEFYYTAIGTVMGAIASLR